MRDSLLRLRRRIAHEFGMCPREHRYGWECKRFPDRCEWPTPTPDSLRNRRHAKRKAAA